MSAANGVGEMEDKDESNTHSIVMQNASIGWNIERASSGDKLPNEMISSFDNCIRLTNVFRPLLLWM